MTEKRYTRRDRNRVEFKVFLRLLFCYRIAGRDRNRVEFKVGRVSDGGISSSVEIGTEWNLKICRIFADFIVKSRRDRNRVEFKEKKNQIFLISLSVEIGTEWNLKFLFPLKDKYNLPVEIGTEWNLKLQVVHLQSSLCSCRDRNRVEFKGNAAEDGHKPVKW